jgi:hypothetical protein
MNNKYGTVCLGSVGKELDKSPEDSSTHAVWCEWGIWYTAPIVDKNKFGGHAYDNGGYELGIRSCPCGCHMGSASSSGPVDPFGPCPENPRQLNLL